MPRMTGMPLLRRADRQMAGTARHLLEQHALSLPDGMTAPPVRRSKEGIHRQTGSGQHMHGTGIIAHGKHRLCCQRQ